MDNLFDEKLNVPDLDINNKEESRGSSEKFGSTKTGQDLRERLERLNYLTIETCINNLESGKIKPNDLGAIVTLLKNNKVIEEKRAISESDIIDSLIEKN